MEKHPEAGAPAPVVGEINSVYYFLDGEIRKEGATAAWSTSRNLRRALDAS